MSRSVSLPMYDFAELRAASMVVLDAQSHVHLAYRPGVQLVKSVVRNGELIKRLVAAELS